MALYQIPFTARTEEEVAVIVSRPEATREIKVTLVSKDHMTVGRVVLSTPEARVLLTTLTEALAIVDARQQA